MAKKLRWDEFPKFPEPEFLQLSRLLRPPCTPTCYSLPCTMPAGTLKDPNVQKTGPWLLGAEGGVWETTQNGVLGVPVQEMLPAQAGGCVCGGPVGAAPRKAAAQ